MLKYYLIKRKKNVEGNFILKVHTGHKYVIMFNL